MWQLTAVMLIVAASTAVALARHAQRPKTMLHNHFEPETARKLEQLVTSPNCLWVTDADGTLWRDDIGEGFLKQLVADGALVSPEAKGVDVWASYEERVAKNKLSGYAWAVQVMEGMREEDVVRRADAFAKSFVPAHLHPEMGALLEAAKAHKCQIAIVSASGQLIVDAASRVLGIPLTHSVGIRTVIRDGVITSELVAPVTYKPGKVEAIQKYLRQQPTLVSGDSSGDTEMMQIAGATGLLMVHPKKTATDLLATGRKSGWLLHTVNSER